MKVLALKGNKVGTADLPGFPNDGRVNEYGDFWVAIHCRRYMCFDAFHCCLPFDMKHEYRFSST